MAALFRRTFLTALRNPRPFVSTLPTAAPSVPLLGRLYSDATPVIHKTIQQLVNHSPVVLFMKGTPDAPQCGFSRATIQILSLQGVDPNKFAAVNVLEDNEIREGVKSFSDWPTIPQLYVNGEFIGGCDIVVNMHQSGELEKVLGEAGVLVGEEPAQEAEKKE